MTGLFAKSEAEHFRKAQPLAARMRPATLAEFVGQQHFLGEGKLLRRLLAADRLGSVIFYGPPGTGKTTLARLLATESQRKFRQLSAVTSGVKELRELLEEARDALAGGWQIAGIARAQSGSPIAVTQATNFNAFAGFGIQRPNRVADPRLPAGQRTTARWFDNAAFTQAPQFTLGSSSRNPVTGPSYGTVDLMLGKTFPITERVQTEFRAEVFNLTNTPPLGNPNGSFGTAAFGTITSALDPRVFELVLKLHF